MSTDVTTKLTEAERRKFNDLDGIIRKGLQTFAEVGASLAIVRDQRLYREEYDSFEAYCQDRCGWSANRAGRLIEAHEVVTGLVAENVPIGTIRNEAQARELLPVPPKKRAVVVAEAKAGADSDGKPVTAERIRETAHKYTPIKDRKPSKPRTETPEDMASAIVKAAQKHKAPEPTKADDGVDTLPVAVTEASSAETSAAPRASSAEGSVVLFVRTLDPTALPEPGDVDGMTDEDVTTVRMVSAWCARVIGAYAIAHKGDV